MYTVTFMPITDQAAALRSKQTVNSEIYIPNNYSMFCTDNIVPQMNFNLYVSYFYKCLWFRHEKINYIYLTLSH